QFVSFFRDRFTRDSGIGGLEDGRLAEFSCHCSDLHCLPFHRCSIPVTSQAWHCPGALFTRTRSVFPLDHRPDLRALVIVGVGGPRADAFAAGPRPIVGIASKRWMHRSEVHWHPPFLCSPAKPFPVPESTGFTC